MDNKNNSLGYKLGQTMACIVCACIAALIISGTIALIRFIF